MEQKLEEYYANNAKKLRAIVDKILLRFGGISDKDTHDFYSLANEVFADVINQYDGVQSFEGFLYTCLSNKIKSEMTARHRQKRCVKIGDTYLPDVSINAPIHEEDGATWEEVLANGFDMDEALFGSSTYNENAERVEMYLNSLPIIVRKVVELRVSGNNIAEILKILNITEKQYERYMKQAKGYEHTKLLKRELNRGIPVRKEIIEMTDPRRYATTTLEKTKDTSFAISAIIKKLKTYQLRDDHVLQRSANQWSNRYKSELISDILQGKSLTQIIISEEFKNGVLMLWLIDGKQRCTNIDEFVNDGFAVSKNVQRYMIEYQTNKLDEDGKPMFNEEGFPIMEIREFDIRGKKFSQLPEELRDKFLEYQVPVMLNLNCTKAEIAYDIARFNRCRPMNVAQNGWTGLEETFAEYVDNILKMPFFKEGFGGSSYRESNNRSGMMRRMIVESIMSINYLDDFNKDFRKMCEFLSEESNDVVFFNFHTLIERISNIAGGDTVDIFNIKDSFLWFALFDRFTKLGMEDDAFVDFILSFKDSLHSCEIDGVSYDILNEKGSKDKSVVIKKLDHLEKLMKDFFDAETIEKDSVEESTSITVEAAVNENKDATDNESVVASFIKENINENVTNEDLEFYKSIVDDLLENVDDTNEVSAAENRPSLVGIVGYACNEDIDLDGWLPQFIKKNHTYIRNQKDNLIYMIKDLRKFFNMEQTDVSLPVAV